MTRRLRSRNGADSANRASRHWVPDVPLADSVRVTKKARRDSPKAPRSKAEAAPKLTEPKNALEPRRWTMACQRQKHDDRPHQDMVMSGMPELCTMIAEYLTQQELSTLSQVCQEWHNYWTAYLYRRVLLNKPILSIGLAKLRFDIYGPFVESLSFVNCEDQDVTKVFQHKFPNLREVDLTRHIFSTPKLLKATLKAIPMSIRRLKISCWSASFTKTSSQDVWYMLSILHELMPDLEELVIHGYTHSSFGLLMLVLKNMISLRVLRFINYRGSYFYYRNPPPDKYAHLDFNGEDWKNTTLETLDISLVMVCSAQPRAGDSPANITDRLTTLFQRVPNLRHLTIDNMEPRMSLDHWHNGVLRHLPNLETLAVHLNNSDVLNVCERLHTYCPRLKSIRLHRAIQRYNLSTNPAIENLPTNLQNISISGLLLHEDELKTFVEQSTLRARTITDGAASGAARLPIMPSSSLLAPLDTMCHTLRRLNLEHCKGITPTAMLYVLEHCSQLECLNMSDTNAGTLELFEEGRPWACAKTLKALSMDLVRFRRDPSSTTSAVGNGGAGSFAAVAGGAVPAQQNVVTVGPPSGHLQQLITNLENTRLSVAFTVHDLRRIRQRLISLEKLKALRLKGNLSRLTVISRGDYKPRDELYTLKEPPVVQIGQNIDHDGQGSSSEDESPDMDIDAEDQQLNSDHDIDHEADDGDNDEDVEQRRQRNASILERLDWAKIDVEMYNIFAERARGGDGGAEGGVHLHRPPFHQNQSQLQKEMERLEHWQVHHYDMKDVWYDYTLPRAQVGTQIFQFRKDGPTGWMAANMASTIPFPL